MSSTYKDYGYRDVGKGYAHSYLLPQLQRMLGTPSGPILDLGCGNGWIATELMARGFDVYGVDASESGIQLANKAKAGHFHVLDVESGTLPPALADKQFSTIISTEVIEHLYDPRKFLAFARRLLVEAGGGTLIISTPYHSYLKYLALAAAGKMDRHLTVLWDGGHIKFFSRKSLEQMLCEQGFQVTGFAGAGRLPYLWKSMLVSARV